MNEEKKITAKLSYLRMGPRKVRLVADLVKGKKLEKALEILMVTNKSAAKPMLKLLQSATANAKHNFSLDASALRVKSILVDGGPMLKRWMPRAHGSASPILKRTSHIWVELEKIKVFAKKEKKDKSAKGESAAGEKKIAKK